MESESESQSDEEHVEGHLDACPLLAETVWLRQFTYERLEAAYLSDEMRKKTARRRMKRWEQKIFDRSEMMSQYPAALMSESIWLNQTCYEEMEAVYHMNNTGALSKKKNAVPPPDTQQQIPLDPRQQIPLEPRQQKLDSMISDLEFKHFFLKQHMNDIREIRQRKIKEALDYMATLSNVVHKATNQIWTEVDQFDCHIKFIRSILGSLWSTLMCIRRKSRSETSKESIAYLSSLVNTMNNLLTWFVDKTESIKLGPLLETVPLIIEIVHQFKFLENVGNIPRTTGKYKKLRNNLRQLGIQVEHDPKLYDKVQSDNVKISTDTEFGKDSLEKSCVINEDNTHANDDGLLSDERYSDTNVNDKDSIAGQDRVTTGVSELADKTTDVKRETDTLVNKPTSVNSNRNNSNESLRLLDRNESSITIHSGMKSTVPVKSSESDEVTKANYDKENKKNWNKNKNVQEAKIMPAQGKETEMSNQVIEMQSKDMDSEKFIMNQPCVLTENITSINDGENSDGSLGGECYIDTTVNDNGSSFGRAFGTITTTNIKSEADTLLNRLMDMNSNGNNTSKSQALPGQNVCSLTKESDMKSDQENSVKPDKTTEGNSDKEKKKRKKKKKIAQEDKMISQNEGSSHCGKDVSVSIARLHQHYRKGIPSLQPLNLTGSSDQSDQAPVDYNVLRYQLAGMFERIEHMLNVSGPSQPLHDLMVEAELLMHSTPNGLKFQHRYSLFKMAYGYQMTEQARLGNTATELPVRSGMATHDRGEPWSTFPDLTTTAHKVAMIYPHCDEDQHHAGISSLVVLKGCSTLVLVDIMNSCLKFYSLNRLEIHHQADFIHFYKLHEPYYMTAFGNDQLAVSRGNRMISVFKIFSKGRFELQHHIKCSFQYYGLGCIKDDIIVGAFYEGNQIHVLRVCQGYLEHITTFKSNFQGPELLSVIPKFRNIVFLERVPSGSVHLSCINIGGKRLFSVSLGGDESDVWNLACTRSKIMCCNKQTSSISLYSEFGTKLTTLNMPHNSIQMPFAFGFSGQGTMFVANDAEFENQNNHYVTTKINVYNCKYLQR